MEQKITKWSNWTKKARDMNMSNMSMSGRGCVALGGEEKDGTEEEGIFVARTQQTSKVL